MVELNPYFAADLFVGRHTFTGRIENWLSGGQSALLIGGRRAGKTSLIRRLDQARLGRRLVVTDVTGWDLGSRALAFGALRSAILGAEQPTATEASRDEVLAVLVAARPLTLVLDDADRLLQAPWGGDVFSLLRHVDDTLLRSDVSVLLAGGPVLARHQDEDTVSPPLNTARPFHMDALPESAVMDLVGLMTERANGIAADVLRYGGCHPFLTAQLLGELWSGASIADACEEVIDISLGTFETWQRQLGADGRELVRSVPSAGLDVAELNSPQWMRLRTAQRVAKSVGVVRKEGGRLVPGPELFRSWLLGRDPAEFTWDIAISYASEDTPIAEAIASQLRDSFKVFYAPYESGALWGTDLYGVLPNTYGVQSRLVLIICTPAYVAKHWTRIEFDAAIKNPNRVLLLEHGALPDDFPPHILHRGSSPAELIGLVEALTNKLAAP